MEVEIFTLADYATDPGNGKLFISGTFDTLLAQTFPVIHPFATIVARIRVGNSEAGNHSIEIRSLDTNKKSLHESLKGNFEVQSNPNSDHTSLNILWNLTNSKLDREGVYGFEFYFDGDFKTGLKLTAKLASNPNTKS